MQSIQKCNKLSNLRIKKCGNLNISNVFASFQGAVSICKIHFFHNLQVVALLTTDRVFKPTCWYNQSYFLCSSYDKSCVSHISNVKSKPYPQALWILETLWEDILKLLHTSSICFSHGLIQCKVVHCSHWTKVKLFKINDTVDLSCEKCHWTSANHVHMFWSCMSP